MIHDLYGNVILINVLGYFIAKNMKFSVKDLFSKCDQLCRKLHIWSHILKEYLMNGNFIFLWCFNVSSQCLGIICIQLRRIAKTPSRIFKIETFETTVKG